jgi:2-methylcitrate dehydratase PrpD
MMASDLTGAASGTVAAGSQSQGLSNRLAEFVVASRWENVPGPIRRQAIRSILNSFGTALGGSQDQAVLRLWAALEPFSSGNDCTVIGHPTKLDMPTAAFLNAVSMNVFDFDDTHEGTIIHPTAPVAAAVFAFAETRFVSGAELLHAFVLGTEVECRIGNAISPGHYDRGWHITSTCGVFGAAVAVGKLLGLDEREMLWALGNASAQSSGLVETLGSMAKSVSVGNAARNGLVAAIMAKHGVEGPLYPLEGPRGFLKVVSDEPDFSALDRDLGVTWELARNMFKPYPCGVVLNPVIDACLSVQASGRIRLDDIESITVVGNPLLKARADRPHVTRGREAQVSAQHAVAVSLLRGSAGIADFGDEAVRAPDVLAFRQKVARIDVDAAIPVESVRLEIRTTDGATTRIEIEAATGSPRKPLTDNDLERKFETLAAFGCSDLRARPLIERLWGLESELDAAGVVRAAAPTVASRY